VDTPRSRALGAELRRLRIGVNPRTSLREFAKQVGVSYVALSRWETGKRVPTSEDVATLLGALRVIGEERERLLAMTRQAQDPNWVAPGVDRQLTALIDFEQTATTIVDVSPLVMPGLLQTADYARVIMDDGVMTTGEVQTAVITRMGRRDILTRDTPVNFLALVGEAALRYPMGGPAVMAAQLRHVRRMAGLPNVTVQAIPTRPGWNPSLSGPFVLYEFPVAAPIVHFEHHRSSMFLPDKKDIEDMRKAVQAIRSVALGPEDTATLITKIEKEIGASP
jgi:transcriptional regulator with XRE-family HTH domain